MRRQDSCSFGRFDLAMLTIVIVATELRLFRGHDRSRKTDAAITNSGMEIPEGRVAVPFLHHPEYFFSSLCPHVFGCSFSTGNNCRDKMPVSCFALPSLCSSISSIER